MKLEKIKNFLSGKEKNKAATKKTGAVIFLNYRRGYGWIQSKQLIKDVFFHIKPMKGVKDQIAVGDKVKFDVGRNSQGYIARNVERLNNNGN